MIDNGLLGAITRSGQSHKFQSFYEGATSMGCNFEKAELVFSPPSLIEAIGLKLPPITVQENKKLSAEAVAAAASESKEYATLINELRVDVYRKYKEKLLNEPALTLKSLEEAVLNQLRYIDKNLKEWFYIQNTRNFKWEEAHDFICSKFAVDLQYAHQYDNALKSGFDAATLVELVQSIERGHNISQVRGLAKLYRNFRRITNDNVWKSFKEDDPVENLPGKIRTNLSRKEILQNITIATNAFTFRKNEDYLDLELIHFSTIGNFSDKKLQKVFSFTAENVKKTKLRIQVMKSLSQHSLELVKSFTKSEFVQNLNFNNGEVGFFDLGSGKLQGKLDVNQEASIFDKIYLEKL